MKRILLILAMAALFPSIASAQLNVQQKYDKVETLASIRIGVVKLVNISGMYSIQMMTSNQFDDLAFFDLGLKLDGAKQTLNDLATLFDEIGKGETIVVKDASNHEVSLYKEMGSLCFKFDGYAGKSSLAKNEIKKMISAIR